LTSYAEESKYSLLMRKIFLSFLLIGTMIGCTSRASVEKSVVTVVSGEMLFSGPNSLQAPVSTSVDNLIEELSIDASSLISIGVSSIQVSLADDQVALAESLLLQIVSNNNEMSSLGTLSPLGDGTTFDLQVAEEIDLLPFMEDEGATWVLDVNLSEDIMDEMQAATELTLTINYKN
jgi:hypothetical protein